MKEKLGRLGPHLGGQLGVGLCLAGFLLVFLGWNGAASRNFVPAQFPYLISGGIAGLCLVLVGVATIVVQNQRADRAELQKTLDRLIEAVEHAGLARSNGHAAATGEGAARDGLVAGYSSYHRAGCHLAAGRSEAEPVTAEEAAERGLEPCRVCEPPQVEPAEDAPALERAPSRRRGPLKAR